MAPVFTIVSWRATAAPGCSSRGVALASAQYGSGNLSQRPGCTSRSTVGAHERTRIVEFPVFVSAASTLNAPNPRLRNAVTAVCSTSTFIEAGIGFVGSRQASVDAMPISNASIRRPRSLMGPLSSAEGDCRAGSWRSDLFSQNPAGRRLVTAMLAALPTAKFASRGRRAAGSPCGASPALRAARRTCSRSGCTVASPWPRGRSDWPPRTMI
jgi:hypothetical protein